MAGRVYWLDQQRPQAPGSRAQEASGCRPQAAIKGQALMMKIGEAFP